MQIFERKATYDPYDFYLIKLSITLLKQISTSKLMNDLNDYHRTARFK
jgi:hypothetical protein